MEAQAVALIIASIGGCIASIIYSFKHIRESECCGSKCVQDTDGIIINECPTQNSIRSTQI